MPFCNQLQRLIQPCARPASSCSCVLDPRNEFQCFVAQIGVSAERSESDSFLHVLRVLVEELEFRLRLSRRQPGIAACCATAKALKPQIKIAQGPARLFIVTQSGQERIVAEDLPDEE